jgi:hypothetical protein
MKQIIEGDCTMSIFGNLSPRLPSSSSQHYFNSVRESNTTVYGTQFDSTTIKIVFTKALKEFGYFFIRKDAFGRSIALHDFGKKNEYGWEIDHIIPVSKGGTDDLSNLQPLHWKSNISKGED